MKLNNYFCRPGQNPRKWHKSEMTAALTANGAKMASVQEVAQGIMTAIEKGTPVAYVPGKWWLIMMVIRHLPRFVFNKMNI